MNKDDKTDEDYNLRSLLEWVKEYGDNGDLPNQDGSGEDAYNFAKMLLEHIDRKNKGGGLI